jgi:hypothetical protein
VTLSTLRQTTVWPAGKVAGFGEKDCAPLVATTLIVTTPLGGVGVVVGVGATGVGATGVASSVEPLHPHVPTVNAIVTATTIARMSFLFLIACLR